MALRLLTDEQITDVVARQVRAHRPDIAIESFRAWRDGAMRGEPDGRVLAEATLEGWTLVTYDQRTIPPLLQEWAALGKSHAGVIFVDERTISSNQVGELVRALLMLWEAEADRDWQDRILFLRPAPREETG